MLPPLLLMSVSRLRVDKLTVSPDRMVMVKSKYFDGGVAVLPLQPVAAYCGGGLPLPVKAEPVTPTLPKALAVTPLAVVAAVVGLATVPNVYCARVVAAEAVVGPASAPRSVRRERAVNFFISLICVSMTTTRHLPANTAFGRPD